MNKTFRSLADSSFTKFDEYKLVFDTCREIELSYAEGFTLIKRVCNHLRSESLSQGDIVIACTPLSIDSVVLCWACLYLGIVFVPVDHNWPEDFIRKIIAETNPKLVLTDNERTGRFDRIVSPGSILLTGVENTENNNIPFSRWINHDGKTVDEELPIVSPGDLAAILYTSGSTGSPKGVMLSHEALFNSGNLVATHFGWNPEDVFMNLGDLHSMSGLRNTSFSPLHAGASFVIANHAERNNVLLVIDLVERLGITYLGIAPTIIRQLNILFSESRKKRISSLKALLCTGGMLARDQLEIFFRNSGKPVLNYYGLTETAGICAGHNMKTFDPSDNSIGPAVGAELIINPDPEFSSEAGTGELLVISRNLMTGYFRKEKETSEVLKDGAFYTGDIVRKRADGCFELIGRKRNFVKNLLTELICIEEIENALEEFPGITEASACGYNGFDEDEKIVAFVVLNNHTKEPLQDYTDKLKTHMTDKVGKNRVPWRYYYEESLPRTTSGKIQRHILKEKLDAYFRTNHPGYF